MNFYPIYRNKKLLPWIKWWLIKGNKIAPKHLSEWINSAEAITLTGVYKGSPLLNLTLNGNTSQTGTPSPESPVPVNVVKGNNTITINDTDYQINLKSKNLLPTIDWTGTKNGCPISLSSDNTFSSNGTTTGTQVLLGIDLIGGATANYALYVNQNATKIKLQPGTYTLSIANVQGTLENVGENFFVVAKYRAGETTGVAIKQTNFASMPMTFTLTEETEIFIGYQVQYTKANNYSFNFMLEQASEPTTYEPYYDYELCKIGTYQDVIYKQNNKYYMEKQIGKVVVNGESSEGWTKLNNCFQTSGELPSDIKAIGSTLNALSNHFKYEYWASGITSNMTNNCFGWNSAKKLTMRYDTCSTANDFKTWLQSNNVIIYYQLATSTTTEITETTLISQLEAIYNAKLNSGTNEITQTPSDLPFYLNFRYYEKG